MKKLEELQTEVNELNEKDRIERLESKGKDIIRRFIRQEEEVVKAMEKIHLMEKKISDGRAEFAIAYASGDMAELKKVEDRYYS